MGTRRRRPNTLPLPGFEAAPALPIIESNGTGSSAVFSTCQRFRYRLTRSFGVAPGRHGVIMFLMLNPSTADAMLNDPTIRRTISYARGWGASELYVGNLFALRSTDPVGLLDVDDPVGPDNDRYLVAMAEMARMVVCAWGDGKGAGAKSKIAARRHAVLELLAVKRKVPLYRLGRTEAGNPRHPLYLRGDLPPAPWNPSDILKEIR
jgi:hypothetical protein